LGEGGEGGGEEVGAGGEGGNEDEGGSSSKMRKGKKTKQTKARRNSSAGGAAAAAAAAAAAVAAIASETGVYLSRIKEQGEEEGGERERALNIKTTTMNMNMNMNINMTMNTMASDEDFTGADSIGATGSTGYLRTGDLGFLSSERGELVFVGRMKDVLVVRGRNYAPQDVEQAVEIASVKEANRTDSSTPPLRRGGTVAFATRALGRDRQQVVVAAEIDTRDSRGVPSRVRKRVLKAMAVRIRRYVITYFSLYSVYVRCTSFAKLTFAMAVRIRSAVSAEFDAVTIDAVLLLKPRTLPRTTSGKLRRNAARISFESKVRLLITLTQYCTVLYSIVLLYYHLFSSSPFSPLLFLLSPSPSSPCISLFSSHYSLPPPLTSSIAPVLSPPPLSPPPLSASPSPLFLPSFFRSSFLPSSALPSFLLPIFRPSPPSLVLPFLPLFLSSFPFPPCSSPLL
jgi:hypothetical protein